MSKVKCVVKKAGIWSYSGGNRTQAAVGSVIEVAPAVAKALKNKVELVGELAVATPEAKEEAKAPEPEAKEEAKAPEPAKGGKPPKPVAK